MRRPFCSVPNNRINKILFAVDTDNIGINLNIPQTNIAQALDVAGKHLSRIGRIVKAYAFGPEATLAVSADALRVRGFVLVQCPRVVVDKQFGVQSESRDTVDPELVRVTTMDINEMPGLTHLAIASGDSHFEPFLRWAISQGLKIIVVAGNRKSLSSKIEALASTDEGGRKMVYILSS